MLNRSKEPVACLFAGMLTLSVFSGISFSGAPFAAAYAEELQSGESFPNCSFEDGQDDLFEVVQDGGDFDISVVDQELSVLIRSCGAGNEANQLRYPGIPLREGCKYKLSFDVRSSIERKIEYCLQAGDGSRHNYKGAFIKIGPESQHFEKEFTMKEPTDLSAALTFEMGLQVNMETDPGEHYIYFDNISLILTDDSGAVLPEEPPVYLNIDQVGYRSTDAKTVVTTGDLAGQDYQIRDTENDEILYSGTFGSAFFDKPTGMELCQGDFTDFALEGDYTITTGELESFPFSISGTVYDDLFRSVFKMMYFQRCGTELTEEYAGIYAHPACHTGEALIYGTDEYKDVSGGWHDAGDYGRYTVTAAKTIADMFLTYEMNPDNSLICSDDLSIPESGNGIPDLLDEARYELEWLFKMQNETSGGVHHKVSGYNFPGEVMPEKETSQLVLVRVSPAATGDFAAVMAKAAGIYETIDPELSSRCLSAAMKAWEYLKRADPLAGYKNPLDVTTGEYGDTSARDEVYWAAVELYLAGQILNRETIDVSEIPKDPAVDLGWIEMGAYGLYDLASAASCSDTLAERQQAAQEKLLSRAEDLCELSEKDGHFVTLGTNYFWGSNMGVANNGMILLMAEKLTGNESFRMTAKRQMDYLLGVNGNGYCFVTGFGTQATANPHHRPSQAKGQAVTGMLCGGPNGYLEDPHAKKVLKGTATALCYIDSDKSYSINEVCIYWNSPLLCLIAGI